MQRLHRWISSRTHKKNRNTSENQPLRRTKVGIDVSSACSKKGSLITRNSSPRRNITSNMGVINSRNVEILPEDVVGNIITSNPTSFTQSSSSNEVPMQKELMTQSAKKRSTTSSPPEETAAGIPPRLTNDVNEVNSGLRDVSSMTIPALISPPLTPIKEDSVSVIMKDVDELEELSSYPDTYIEPIPSTETHKLPPRPSADFLNMPTEIILHILSFMPYDDHSTLYSTCNRFRNLLISNDEFLYSKTIAKAGGNPRGESLLTRAIFAFQYMNYPLNSTNEVPQPDINTNISYIRYLTCNWMIVSRIRELIQHDPFKQYLFSDEGKQQLRLTAHGSHISDDIYYTNEVERDLMHLWEFVNYSEDKLVRLSKPRYYPLNDQKQHFNSNIPIELPTEIESKDVEMSRTTSSRSLIKGKGKDGKIAHDEFLVWERKRLLESRNEYWKEDSENLSKVESKDLRWILEVLKAVMVGVVLKNWILPLPEPTLIPEPSVISTESVMVDADSSQSSDDAGNTSTQESNISVESGLPTPPISPPLESESKKVEELGSKETRIKYSTMFTENDIRAYTSYLIAIGGLKLFKGILLRSLQTGGPLSPEEFEGVLKEWDNHRRNGQVPGLFSSASVADYDSSLPDPNSTIPDEDDKSNEKETFTKFWKRTRIERLWERDCRRGGWRNWEGWVAEYYVLG